MVGLVVSIILGLNTTANMGWHNLTASTAVNSTQIAEGGTALNKKGHPEFVVVKNLNDLFGKVAAASSEGKSVMVDLYADWCVACKEFEARTFPDPAVIKALENTVWMQIDLTDNTPEGLEFQEYFDITGLPTILFFDKDGYELSRSRVTGFMKAEPFAQHVERALSQD
jgi:thiol:disulfide interchange protein DsbD